MAPEDNGGYAPDVEAVADLKAAVGGSVGGHHAGTGISSEVLPGSEADQVAAAYDSFDRLMQDTTVHSAELLRRVLALPTVAAREVAQIRSEAERRIRSEQDAQRSVLTALLEELNAGRERAETLADGLGRLLQDFAALSDRASTALAEIGTRAELGDNSAASVADEDRGAAGQRAVATEAATAASNDGAGLSSNGAATESSIADAPAEAGQHSVSLVVHGARPTTALSLRRYLAGLPHVANVKVREYAGDALYAQLAVERPFTAEDFRAWANGSGLEIVSLTDGAVELKLADVPAPS